MTSGRFLRPTGPFRRCHRQLQSEGGIEGGHQERRPGALLTSPARRITPVPDVATRAAYKLYRIRLRVTELMQFAAALPHRDHGWSEIAEGVTRLAQSAESLGRSGRPWCPVSRWRPARSQPAVLERRSRSRPRMGSRRSRSTTPRRFRVRDAARRGGASTRITSPIGANACSTPESARPEVGEVIGRARRAVLILALVQHTGFHEHLQPGCQPVARRARVLRTIAENRWFRTAPRVLPATTTGSPTNGQRGRDREGRPLSL